MKTGLVAAALLLLALQCRAEDVGQLAARCAPSVHPVTMSNIVRVESGGDALAIADAGPAGLPWSVRKKMVRSFRPKSVDAAVQIVEDLHSKGHLVAVGLTQVNTKNAPGLGLSIRDLFDACKNMSAGGSILTSFYEKALVKFKSPEQALQAALSAYNTGDYERGVGNGYVSQVVSGRSIPSLKLGSRPAVEARRSNGLLAAKLSAIEVSSF